MSTPPPPLRALVHAESLADAQQVQAMLPPESVHCALCVDASRLAEAADAHPVDVVLLAGRTLAHARAAMSGLYGGPRAVLRPYQRVLLLPAQHEVRDASTLCLAGIADDYVQHWPIPLDGLRLHLSIKLLGRELAMARAALPPCPTLPTASVPSKPPEALRAIAATPAAPSIDRSKPWALLVDDDRFQYKMLRTVLLGTPLQAAWAATGPDALLMLRQHRPDLILMDIDMPELDGIETVRQVRALPQLAEVPIIMLTGNSDRERVVASLGAGANAFIVKPFSRQRLLEVAAKLLPIMA